MWSVNTMFSACSACKTVYPVSAAQLRAASGRVRCGNCDEIFEATHALFDNPQQAREHAEQQLTDVTREIDDLVGRALDEVPATEAGVGGEPDAETLSSDVPAEIPEPPPETEIYAQSLSDVTDLLDIAISAVNERSRVDVDTYAAPVAAEFVSCVSRELTPDEQTPSEAILFDPAPVEARTSWGAIAAALLLTLLLNGQYIWSERYNMSAIPALRPYLETACATLGCDLPLRHEVEKLEVQEREIRNHPHVNDALLVSATFKNTADFSQRYPIFEVAFSDVSGTPVAVRRFMPEDYLDGVDPSRGMEPGQQTRVMLEIVDPGIRAMSFQFDFL
ncbi:hypothetical protein MNBD_GAMMA15-1763 [hydrothermal vent metagenome]|uniref:Zinc finger/thioredoxin putative domain-containing protein n=1 Tax=hydrothermal vent metagenome TaxID=652676 RepID=A0A3B0YYV0_9ZZZZ